ncbi:FAD-dependent oxidoreductase [Aquimarina sp. TRL1]|uniref:NAD(P)/FAD-dependent oxidoreductase n=1 Tax=Aquimarina sp. (strain TRL1) TaxID=2736252 RepID=UPI00158C25AA|nr:FAD-dependent oxidoreductase [Aquimarina sp. TRL1]QKX04280.1 FAD-dependent oxidoreductase [Aquimarina sp. TRL1]
MKYDIAIIGMGITGLTTANLIHKRFPDKKMLLIEKQEIGQGTSYYSAGFNPPLSISDQAKQSYKTSSTLIKTLAKEVGYVLPDTIDVVYMTEDRKSLIEKYCKPAEHLNDTSTVPAGSISHFFKKEIGGSFYIGKGDGSYVDARSYCEKLANNLTANGLDINTQTYVTELSKKGDYFQIITHLSAIYESKDVIVSTGPFLNTFEPNKKISRNKKVCAFSINIEPEKNDCAFIFLDDEAFLLPLHKEKKWLLSITSTEWGIDPDKKITVTSEDFVMAKKVLNKYTNAFDEYIGEAIVFADNYSDQKEIKVEKNEAIYVRGTSGGGVRYAPATGLKIIEKLGYK